MEALAMTPKIIDAQMPTKATHIPTPQALAPNCITSCFISLNSLFSSLVLGSFITVQRRIQAFEELVRKIMDTPELMASVHPDTPGGGKVDVSKAKTGGTGSTACAC
jgi:hypothetical protein